MLSYFKCFICFNYYNNAIFAGFVHFFVIYMYIYLLFSFVIMAKAPPPIKLVQRMEQPMNLPGPAPPPPTPATLQAQVMAQPPLMGLPVTKMSPYETFESMPPTANNLVHMQPTPAGYKLYQSVYSKHAQHNPYGIYSSYNKMPLVQDIYCPPKPPVLVRRATPHVMQSHYQAHKTYCDDVAYYRLNCGKPSSASVPGAGVYQQHSRFSTSQGHGHGYEAAYCQPKSSGYNGKHRSKKYHVEREEGGKCSDSDIKNTYDLIENVENYIGSSSSSKQKSDSRVGNGRKIYVIHESSLNQDSRRSTGAALGGASGRAQSPNNKKLNRKIIVIDECPSASETANGHSKSHKKKYDYESTENAYQRSSHNHNKQREGREAFNRSNNYHSEYPSIDSGYKQERRNAYYTDSSARAG
jgi:hypothetical protein